MNQGKRYLRNTAYALLGGVFLFVGLNRLHAAAIDRGASAQTRNVLALGLVQVSERQGPRAPVAAVLDPASLRDFKRLLVEGAVDVEIVGAVQYKVSLASSTGEPAQLFGWQQGDLLWVKAAPGVVTRGAVLRIEVPSLTNVSATDTSQLTIRGINAQLLSVRLRNVGAFALRENQVGRWRLFSSSEVPDSLLEVRADKATLSAGSISAAGNLAIRYTE